MSDDLGKIAAISSIGLQGRDLALNNFYHNRSISATGAKILVKL
jgi:hypothetical protein